MIQDKHCLSLSGASGHRLGQLLRVTGGLQIKSLRAQDLGRLASHLAIVGSGCSGHLDWRGAQQVL